jgi:hypothetical protein
VLEEMRKAGTAEGLVFGTDVIPNVNGNRGRSVIFRQDHGKTIWEFVRFKGNLDGIGSGRVFLLPQQWLEQRDRQNEGQR